MLLTHVVTIHNSDKHTSIRKKTSIAGAYAGFLRSGRPTLKLWGFLVHMSQVAKRFEGVSRAIFNHFLDEKSSQKIMYIQDFFIDPFIMLHPH